jgi:hypothetical protein
MVRLVHDHPSIAKDVAAACMREANQFGGLYGCDDEFISDMITTHLSLAIRTGRVTVKKDGDDSVRSVAELKALLAAVEKEAVAWGQQEKDLKVAELKALLAAADKERQAKEEQLITLLKDENKENKEKKEKKQKNDNKEKKVAELKALLAACDEEEEGEDELEERAMEDPDEEKCQARTWGGGFGPQCSKNRVVGGCLCKMHQVKADDNDGTWWLGLITEPRPENPMNPSGMGGTAGVHEWKITTDGEEIVEDDDDEVIWLNKTYQGVEYILETNRIIDPNDYTEMGEWNEDKECIDFDDEESKEKHEMYVEENQ